MELIHAVFAVVGTNILAIVGTVRYVSWRKQREDDELAKHWL